MNTNLKSDVFSSVLQNSIKAALLHNYLTIQSHYFGLLCHKVISFWRIIIASCVRLKLKKPKARSESALVNSFGIPAWEVPINQITRGRCLHFISSSKMFKINQISLGNI